MQMTDVSEASWAHWLGFWICVPFPSLMYARGEDVRGGESGHDPMPSEVPSFGTWGLRPGHPS